MPLLDSRVGMTDFIYVPSLSRIEWFYHEDLTWQKENVGDAQWLNAISTSLIARPSPREAVVALKSAVAWRF